MVALQPTDEAHTLVDLHLEAVPGLGTFTVGRLAGLFLFKSRVSLYDTRKANAYVKRLRD